MCVKCNIKKYQRDDLFCSASTSSTAARTAATTKAEKVQSFPWIRDSTRSIRSFGNRMVLFVVGGIEGILKDMRYTSQSIYWFSLIHQISLLCKEKKKTHSHLWVRNCVQVQPAGGDGGIRTHVPISRQNDFESFPPCDFWWKLSEDGSTQRKPKSCGILRILASVFRFYLNPQGFPSSSHFCPELWPEDRTRIELDARLGVFTPIPFHENANHHFD